jgi:hypothetical protein
VVDKLAGAKEFILSLVGDGERHSRQEILSKGKQAGYGRQTLDTARGELVESEELEEAKDGKQTFVWLPNNVTTVPDIYRNSSNVIREESEDFSEDEPAWVTGDLSDLTAKLEEES